jgi:predicted Zn-dependent protease
VRAPIPDQADLLALADRALAFLPDEGQVTACWERAVEVGEEARLEDRTWVEAVSVAGGARGAARTTLLDDDSLRALALAAAAPGALPRSGRLPTPAAGRSHGAWDGALARVDLSRARSLAAGNRLRWQGGAARVAIVSSRGVRAYEQRSFAEATAYGVRANAEAVSARAAAPGIGRIDLGALAAEAEDLAGEGAPQRAAAGEPPVVLGPPAVAAILESLKPALVADPDLSLPAGVRVASSCVNLSDSARFPATLARSYDAEGMPRRPVALVQDGVAHRVVGDSATARALPGAEPTGHARLAGLPAAWPDHLVLVGGGAEDVAELMRPIPEGLFIPALEDLEADADGWSALTDGAFAIAGGRRGAPVQATEVTWDPQAVLEKVQALTMRQRLVIPPPHPHLDEEPLSARTVGATVAPAVRCGGGLRTA